MPLHGSPSRRTAEVTAFLVWAANYDTSGGLTRCDRWLSCYQLTGVPRQAFPVHYRQRSWCNHLQGYAALSITARPHANLVLFHTQLRGHLPDTRRGLPGFDELLGRNVVHESPPLPKCIA